MILCFVTEKRVCGFVQWIDPLIPNRAREIVEEKQRIVAPLNAELKIYKLLMLSS